MNKVLFLALLAGSLLLLNSPEVSAGPEVRDPHRQPAHRYYRPYNRDHHSYRGYRRDHRNSGYRRAHAMPRWLYNDHSFRRWYGQSRYRHDRRVSWYGLFDVYRDVHH